MSVSSRFLCRHCEPATSSSWTISAPTRLPECAKRSAAGASLLFLPPDSPDLNPIEQAFAKLKALLRAKKLRTVEAFWDALGTLPDCFASEECANSEELLDD